MSVKDKLEKKLRIYIIAHSPSRAYEWMIAHGFLVEGTWRDPRVVILAQADQVLGLHETPDVHFQFLEGWYRGRSQEFKNVMWARLPHVMQRNRIL